MEQNKLDILTRALAREKKARKQAEEILEIKSKELYLLSEELKQSNEVLKEIVSESSSELKGVFENLVDAYILIDLEWNVIKMNKSASVLLGKASEGENLSAMSLIHIEERDRIKEAFKELIEKHSISNYTTRVSDNDNDIELVSINASLIYDRFNSPIGVQAIVRDVTLENRYQVNMEVRKQKYTNIIANMNLGLIEVDLEDNIIMANNSFERMSGYLEEEVIGKKGIDILVVKEDRETFNKKMDKRIDGVSDSYEVRIKDKKGDIKNWLISGAPNYDNNGKVIGSIGIHLDITEIKRLENQKEVLLSRLKTSNNELQEYAHVVSHDLKSPLRNIHALLSWIKEEEIENLKPSSKENIELIEESLEKMEDLITNILKYSSVTSDLEEDELIAINQVIRDLDKVIKIPQNIKIKVADNLPTLKGNKVRFQQLFQNLIGNSIHYMDKEEGLIEIQVKSLKDYYEFSVSDNGIGIEKKDFEKVFKIFQSLSDRKESSGIGLSIVKKIVDHYQGEIWLESTFGEGTTFYFTIKK